MRRVRCAYEIVARESSPEMLTIRDIGDGRSRTVTNDAESVVQELHALGMLPHGRLLRYYDSIGELDELLHDGAGGFVGFASGPTCSAPCQQAVLSCPPYGTRCPQECPRWREARP